MPITAIVGGIGKMAQASQGVSAIDGMFEGWIPQVNLTQSVTIQGKKGTSVRTTLHMALATAFGMSVTRNGDKFSIRAEVDQVNNIAKVDFAIVTSSLASIIKAITGGTGPQPSAPNTPATIPATAAGTSGRITSGFFNDPTAGDDTNVLAGISGVIVNNTNEFGDLEPQGSDYFGNPKSVLINSPPDPVVRGVLGPTIQTEPVIAPWLLERTHTS